MEERFLNRPEVLIDQDEYIRLLGYPIGHKLDGRAKELADITRSWYTENGQPWMYFRKANNYELKDQIFVIDGVEFESKAVWDRFRKSDVQDVFLVAVSAGTECEDQAGKLWKESKPDEYFFMEMYGSAVVENLIMQASAHICSWADENQLAVLPHYSPGYAQWDVIDQLKLIELIQNGDRGEQLKVESLSSGMLKPKKSLLAIIGITKEHSKLTLVPGMVPCEKCALKGCQYRRKPYRYSKGNQQQTPTNRILSFENEEEMNEKVNYTLKEKVLNKWVDQRLTLDHHDAGEIHAKFIYDGTTCSGTGFPLKFEYSIILKESKNDFVILDTRCDPAEKDIGHTKMCQFIKKGSDLLDTINEEKDWVGKTLTEIINTETNYLPSGCYCEKSGRDYKWSQISQVLHYGLTKRQPKETGVKVA